MCRSNFIFLPFLSLLSLYFVLRVKNSNTLVPFIRTYISFSRQSHMTAATFESNQSQPGIVGWFNNEGYHSPAQILNILGNTLLHYFVSEDKSIQCSNHPLPRASSIQIEEELNTSIPLAIFISYNVVFGMCFLVATFVLFLIKERVSKAKHIQVDLDLFFVLCHVQQPGSYCDG